MKSARTVIVAVTALLVLLPFFLLGVAWVYERFLISAQLGQLAALSAQPVGAVATQRVWVRVISPTGAVQFDSKNAAQAESFSFLGGLFESFFEGVGAPSPIESLERLEAQSPPFLEREEVAAALKGSAVGTSRTSPSGASIAICWAKPMSDGSVLLLTRANHRGVRQLLLARNQLAKLVLLQLIIAMLVAYVLAKWLVTPLEHLARGARRFPTQPIADAPLAARRDELGQVARAFNELAQSLEARRSATVQLAADMAHELKNPLATIEAASELMASTRDPSYEKRGQLHGIIHEAVRRLERTAESLLAEVRLETALAQARRDPLAYTPWLDALLAAYRADPRYAAWAFELDAHPSVERISVNGDAWGRLVRNLIDNALVQPSAKRVIRVEVRRTESEIITDVIDFGPGVSEGNRDKVFRRFFTARPEGVEAGTGLGLAIVEAIAFAHGGRVILLPSAPERGAAFRVTLSH